MRDIRYTTLIAAAAVLVAVGVSSAFTQGYGSRNRPAAGGGSATISGRVILPDGTPAVGAGVNLASSDVNMSTTTDHDGAYSFGNVAGGNYTITAKADGLPDASESYSIDSDTGGGATISVPIFMRLAGQKKGDMYTNNPLFKDVPAAALDKFKKGEEKLGTNDAKGALSAFDEVIAAYPSFAAAYYGRGQAYLKLNDDDKALESFVKAIQLRSDYTDAKYSVGYTQYLKNNFEVAAAVFDDVLQAKDTPDAQLYLGISLAKLKNVDAAIPHLKAAVAGRDDQSTALAHRYLGGIYMQKKQNADAANELEKYVKLVPKAPDADKLKSTIADLRKSS